MAEWLGSGLQHHLQRFESASDLIVKMESPVVTATAGLLLLRVPTDGLKPSLGIPDATSRKAVVSNDVAPADSGVVVAQCTPP